MRLEEINLLNDPKNCIESSSTIGFILEEFIVQKLKNLFKNEGMLRFDIQRDNSGQHANLLIFFNIWTKSFFVNIKANKGNNNAIAVINKLYKYYT